MKINLLSLVSVVSVSDLPQALRDLANEVEQDIKLHGTDANALGISESGADFHYFIDVSDKELSDFLNNNI